MRSAGNQGAHQNADMLTAAEIEIFGFVRFSRYLVYVNRKAAMLHVLLGVSLLILATAPQSDARSEYILGGETGNPWQAAVSEDPGSYIVFGPVNEQIDWVSVTIPPRGEGADSLIDYSNNTLKPVRIDPSWNLARRFDLAGGLFTSSQAALYLDAHLKTIKLAFDGDPKTATFRAFTQDPNAPPGVGEGWRENIIVNFGADLPISRIRFYPRLGDDDELIIAKMAAPEPDSSAFGRESFSENYLEWFAIGVADHTAPFSQATFPPPGKRWFYNYREKRTADDPAFTKLIETRENLDVVVDFRFPRRHEQYVAIRPFKPVRDWEIAEFEVYGEGYVRKAVYMTHILDFGHPVNWGKIRWAGELPPDTRLEIRTRTGSDPDPENYWKENPITGELEPVPKGEHLQIRADRRPPPTYDTENWSFWSPPYDVEAGRRDPVTPAEMWEDGTSLQSPSPRRYLQIHIVAYATRNTAPRLDALWLQFAQSPSASQLVGEIWPISVSTLGPQTFVYIVRPQFEPDDTGFDRIEILTYTKVDTVRAVKVHGTEIDLAAFPPEVLSDRIVVVLPKLQGAEDNLKQVEVCFDAVVLRFGAEFSGWVFNSDDPDRLKQRIEPGNATFRYGGDVLSVRTRVGGNLLVSVKASPNPFTPNGDGLNDELSLTFKVREVVTQRALCVEIYDLSGRRIRTLIARTATTGAHEFTWDGRDDSGRKVSPGVYLYRISLDADKRKEENLGSIAVAY